MSSEVNKDKKESRLESQKFVLLIPMGFSYIMQKEYELRFLFMLWNKQKILKRGTCNNYFSMFFQKCFRCRSVFFHMAVFGYNITYFIKFLRSVV